MTGYVTNLMPRFLVIDPANDDGFRAALTEGPVKIHHLLQKEGEQDPKKARMGTTLTVAYIVWPYLYVVHVGDTRCYLFRNGQLWQLTTDHTVAQYFTDAGESQIALSHNTSLQNTLWNCISATRTPPEPQIDREQLRAGDRVLRCSDGLTKHLSMTDIAAVLESAKSLEEQTKHLIQESNSRGGRDNISVVIGAFEGRPDAE